MNITKRNEIEIIFLYHIFLNILQFSILKSNELMGEPRRWTDVRGDSGPCCWKTQAATEEVTCTTPHSPYLQIS